MLGMIGPLEANKSPPRLIGTLPSNLRRVILFAPVSVRLFTVDGDSEKLVDEGGEETRFSGNGDRSKP